MKLGVPLHTVHEAGAIPAYGFNDAIIAGNRLHLHVAPQTVHRLMMYGYHIATAGAIEPFRQSAPLSKTDVMGVLVVLAAFVMNDTWSL